MISSVSGLVGGFVVVSRVRVKVEGENEVCIQKSK